MEVTLSAEQQHLFELMNEEVMGLRLVKWMAEQEETEQELKELEALAA